MPTQARGSGRRTPPYAPRGGSRLVVESSRAPGGLCLATLPPGARHHAGDDTPLRPVRLGLSGFGALLLAFPEPDAVGGSLGEGRTVLRLPFGKYKGWPLAE